MALVFWNPQVVLRPVTAAFRPSLARAAEAARAQAPRRTGNLRRSIRAINTGPLSGAIFVPVKYAAAVERGSRAHVIRPRSLKEALAGRGLRHPVRRVNHPGTRPHPFVRPGAAAWPVFYVMESRRRFGR